MITVGFYDRRTDDDQTIQNFPFLSFDNFDSHWSVSQSIFHIIHYIYTHIFNIFIDIL